MAVRGRRQRRGRTHIAHLVDHRGFFRVFHPVGERRRLDHEGHLAGPERFERIAPVVGGAARRRILEQLAVQGGGFHCLRRIEGRHAIVFPLAAGGQHERRPAPDIHARAALTARRPAVNMGRIIQFFHGGDQFVERLGHGDAGLFQQVAAVEQEVAAADQGREIRHALVGSDGAAARQEVLVIGLLGQVFEQRHDPAGGGKFGHVGFVDVIDLVGTGPGRGVEAGLGAAVVFAEIADLDLGAVFLFILGQGLFHHRQPQAFLRQHLEHGHRATLRRGVGKPGGHEGAPCNSSNDFHHESPFL